MTSEVYFRKLFKPCQLHNSRKTSWIPFGTRKWEADFRSPQRQSVLLVHFLINPDVTGEQMSTQNMIFVPVIYDLIYIHTYANLCLIFALHYLIIMLFNCKIASVIWASAASEKRREATWYCGTIPRIIANKIGSEC